MQLSVTLYIVAVSLCVAMTAVRFESHLLMSIIITVAQQYATLLFGSFIFHEFCQHLFSVSSIPRRWYQF